MLVSQSGCTEGQKSAEQEKVDTGPIFYPEPPELVRMQFLTSFSGADVVVNMHGGFESFIMGDLKEEEVKGGIAKPYGIDIFEGKIYICDVGQRRVVILDPEDGSFEYLTEDKRVVNPVNIEIDDNGNKYIADTGSGSIFVFNRQNIMTDILFTDLGVSPIDFEVRGDRFYIADMKGSRVVVANRDGTEVMRFGTQGREPGQFVMITGIAVDDDENIYVSDKITATVSIFNKEGIFQDSFGKQGLGIHDFVRPKGIDLDREGRLWVVDTSTTIGKIYNEEHRLLLFFGMPVEGKEAGAMSFPVSIRVDYDNVEYFQKYAVPGAEIELIVLVANQYGDNKVAVYGYGTFPQ
jgi:DNA-binding beta-propeller fold protein YncE